MSDDPADAPTFRMDVEPEDEEPEDESFAPGTSERAFMDIIVFDTLVGGRKYAEGELPHRILTLSSG
jgi:hypothetical protein